MKWSRPLNSNSVEVWNVLWKSSTKFATTIKWTALRYVCVDSSSDLGRIKQLPDTGFKSQACVEPTTNAMDRWTPVFIIMLFRFGLKSTRGLIWTSIDPWKVNGLNNKQSVRACLFMPRFQIMQNCRHGAKHSRPENEIQKVKWAVGQQRRDGHPTRML